MPSVQPAQRSSPDDDASFWDWLLFVALPARGWAVARSPGRPVFAICRDSPVSAPRSPLSAESGEVRLATMSHAFPSPPDHIAAPALRPSAYRLLDLLAEAGGGPVRPGDLGAIVRIGHTAQAEGLGQLRREGLIEGPIHEVSLTAAGWELARRRQGLREPLPAARADAPIAVVSDAPAVEPAGDGTSPEDPDAHELAPAARPPAPPGDGSVDLVRAAPSAEPSQRTSPEEGASDGWGWLFLAGTFGAVLWWLRSREGAAAGTVRAIPEEGPSPVQRAAPAPASFQAPTVPDYVLQAQRRLHGR